VLQAGHVQENQEPIDGDDFQRGILRGVFADCVGISGEIAGGGTEKADSSGGKES
jgi:hypothetical protein